MIRSALRRRSDRPGFTIIELLVVIGLMMVLAGMTMAFLPAVYQRNEATRGAQTIQTTLAMARMRAKRDGVNYGVRFLPSANPSVIPRYATDLQFVQQPLDITGAPGVTARAAAGSNLVVINGANLAPVAQDLTPPPGMAVAPPPSPYLVLNGNGTPHRIVAADGGGGGVRIADALPYGIPSTSEFRITRRAQAVQGEAIVKLPTKIAVDFALCSFDDGQNPLIKSNQPFMFLLTAGGLDIVFTPRGELTNQQWPNNTLSKVVLYVRDYTDQDPKGGSPAVIAIYTKTGFIAVHPIDPYDPYNLTNNTRSSGL